MFARNILTGLVLLLAFSRGAFSQQQAEPTSQPPAAGPPTEFHVDGGCNIFEMLDTPKGPKEHRYKDTGICEIIIPHETRWQETDMDSGQRRHINITVMEHTFVLHNPTSVPVTFFVNQFVDSGWEVDSDPQPKGWVGNVATFVVQAKLRETVQLHVGERNTR